MGAQCSSARNADVRGEDPQDDATPTTIAQVTNTKLGAKERDAAAKGSAAAKLARANKQAVVPLPASEEARVAQCNAFWKALTKNQKSETDSFFAAPKPDPKQYPLEKYTMLQRYYDGLVRLRDDILVAKFPLLALTTDTFMGLDKLSAYEEMQDQLINISDMTPEDRKKHYLIFLSHQWTGGTHPDVDGSQLAIMKRAVQASCEQRKKRVKQRKVLIWVDYCCFPQADTSEARAEQQKAIDSLCAYVRQADDFVAVTPDVEDHFEARRAATGQTRLSRDTYLQRGWCTVECLARACVGQHANCTQTGDDFEVVGGGMVEASGNSVYGFEFGDVTSKLFPTEKDFTCCFLEHPNGMACDKSRMANLLLGCYALAVTSQIAQGGLENLVTASTTSNISHFLMSPYIKDPLIGIGFAGQLHSNLHRLLPEQWCASSLATLKSMCGPPLSLSNHSWSMQSNVASDFMALLLAASRCGLLLRDPEQRRPFDPFGKIEDFDSDSDEKPW